MDYAMEYSPQSKKAQRNRKSKQRSDGESGGTKNEQLEESYSPFMKAFLQFQKDLDCKYDKRERIIKLSRDITICSKRVIFMLHRSSDEESFSNTLQNADKKVEEIQGYLASIAKELVDEDPYKFARAYSGGMQEFVEAVTFVHFIRENELLSYKDLHEKYLSFEVNDESEVQSCVGSSLLTPMDYILGVADLTGELMRMSINQISTGNQEKGIEICCFLQTLHDHFLTLSGTKDLGQKVKVLKQSLRKVENACYTIKLRGSELPQHMLVDLIKMGDLLAKAPNADE